jgi:starvation-inducible DNA-binding protein
MEELVKSLKVSLATVFSFYLKTQYYHWNVEGADFYQYHKMFEQIYTDVYGSIDPLAEHLRALQSYAPGSYKRFAELSKVEDETKVPTGAVMVERLLEDNVKVIEALDASMKLATTHNKQGLINFLGERIEEHNKWAWFLRATKKGE